jgi:hypothetical protein
MKKLIALCATSVLFAGCGGGGGGSSPEAAPAPSQLAAYAGVWQSACDSHERETATFTLGANGTLEISSKTGYFSVAGSSAPSFFMQVTGPGVVRTTKNGKPQWRIDCGGGSSTCIMDDGVQGPKSGSGGLYARGNQLFSLETSGSSFVVDRIYTKK